jgi:hypothetical protein
MKISIAGRVGIVLLGAMLGACASKPDVTPYVQTEDSGFLRDYSSLQWSKGAQGQPVRTWVSPKLTPANYDAILLDPLVFYPEPKPNEQVSAKELQRILTYANDVYRRSLGQRFKVVDRAGPGVVRLRAAFTSVGAQEEGLKPYQMIPMAFVATMAKEAVEGAPQRAFILIEVEATDSVTGELLGERIRVGTGERLAKVAGKKVITLDTVKPLLDELAAEALPNLERYVKPK